VFGTRLDESLAGMCLAPTYEMMWIGWRNGTYAESLIAGGLVIQAELRDKHVAAA
jgi:hypothetical protein